VASDSHVLELTHPTINETMRLYIEIDLENDLLKALDKPSEVNWNNVAYHLDRLRDRLLSNKYERKRGAIENMNDVVTAYMEEL
jgi:hypothetical protein